MVEKKDDEDEQLTPAASPYGRTRSSRSIPKTETCPLCKGNPPDPRAEPCEVCNGGRFTNNTIKFSSWKSNYELWKGRNPGKW